MLGSIKLAAKVVSSSRAGVSFLPALLCALLAIVPAFLVAPNTLLEQCCKGNGLGPCLSPCISGRFLPYVLGFPVWGRCESHLSWVLLHSGTLRIATSKSLWSSRYCRCLNRYQYYGPMFNSSYRYLRYTYDIGDYIADTMPQDEKQLISLGESVIGDMSF